MHAVHSVAGVSFVRRKKFSEQTLHSLLPAAELRPLGQATHSFSFKYNPCGQPHSPAQRVRGLGRVEREQEGKGESKNEGGSGDGSAGWGQGLGESLPVVPAVKPPSRKCMGITRSAFGRRECRLWKVRQSVPRSGKLLEC